MLLPVFSNTFYALKLASSLVSCIHLRPLEKILQSNYFKYLIKSFLLLLLCSTQLPLTSSKRKTGWLIIGHRSLMREAAMHACAGNRKKWSATDLRTSTYNQSVFKTHHGHARLACRRKRRVENQPPDRPVVQDTLRIIPSSSLHQKRVCSSFVVILWAFQQFFTLFFSSPVNVR